jgi:hypothetical protein
MGTRPLLWLLYVAEVALDGPQPSTLPKLKPGFIPDGAIFIIYVLFIFPFNPLAEIHGLNIPTLPLVFQILREWRSVGPVEAHADQGHSSFRDVAMDEMGRGDMLFRLHRKDSDGPFVQEFYKVWALRWQRSVLDRYYEACRLEHLGVTGIYQAECSTAG